VLLNLLASRIKLIIGILTLDLSLFTFHPRYERVADFVAEVWSVGPSQDPIRIYVLKVHPHRFNRFILSFPFLLSVCLCLAFCGCLMEGFLHPLVSPSPTFLHFFRRFL
jgi:hypothetical protein